MGRDFVFDDADVAIIGRACRLPGAPSVEALWRLLDAGDCAVSTIPKDRWPLERYWHPRPKEPGRSYTWAAGVLPDIWGFDPAVFGVSPREALQMDPQQRLLLELAFEACEDAGFAPSSLAGSQTGVYVGASALDYSTIGLDDPAVEDAYHATGNALSILSNRLSYVFDLHGPSLTIDTACSSALVALHQARQALALGEVDVALLGGVNALLGPSGFISFSQATMLSPTGLCHAFAAEADGYVRAEGGVVLVLKPLKKAIADGDRIHAVICGSAVNSDGRTTGISLPSLKYQTELLQTVYRQAGVEPDSVAFVEAHGTGTKVGDPVEAAALGAVLGRARATPLPIGSIKSNIGHTEPASGLAGLMKAMLALEHDMAPKTLHAENLNPNIDLAGLNLMVTRDAVPLPRAGGRRFAGVSSFGFGGTSAHVVIADPPSRLHHPDGRPRLLMISAQTEEALRALAGAYAGVSAGASPAERRRVVAATGRRRERMRERLALPVGETDGLPSVLARFARSGEADAASVRARAIEGDGSIAFVFSGNGSQWSGMGRAAYRANSDFREALAEVDSHFRPLAGWSLVEALASLEFADDLAHTDLAQPLIFAIQAASVRALAKVGVRPTLALGHSVGEVAAAEAAGVLTLADAVRVVFHRSRLQRATENSGGMAALFGAREPAESLVQAIPDLVVAAHNSHRCVVAAGGPAALDRLIELAPTYKLKARRLDLPYPFHTWLMAPLKTPLIESLAGLEPGDDAIPFLSTVTGAVQQGASAGAAYWWRNVRDTVLFQEGIERAIAMGKRVFLEIGPRPTLKGHVRDIAERLGADALVDSALVEDAGADDPFEATARRLLVGGAEVSAQWAFGPDVGPGIDLPVYPWRRAPYRFAETTEATGRLGVKPSHPLIGASVRDGSLEWRAAVDLEVEPALADHRIDGQTLLPGAAFVEMGLAIARDWAGEGAGLSDFEILQPMALPAHGAREILCRVDPSTSVVEIMSRPRLVRAAYATHARGKIIHEPGPASGAPRAPAARTEIIEGDAIYAEARRRGLAFGPAFRGLQRASRLADGRIEVELTSAAGDPRYGLDPARLDSCFHGLVLAFSSREGEGEAYLPVRFDEARFILPGAELARADIRTSRCDERVIVADFDLFDREGRVVATLRGARYQATRPSASVGLAELGLTFKWIPAAAEFGDPTPLARWRQDVEAEPPAAGDVSGGALLLEGWATAASLEFARALASEGVIDLDVLVARGRLAEARLAPITAILAELERSGLIERSGSVWRLGAVETPPGEAVFAALAADYPERAPDLLIAASAAEALKARAHGGEALAPSESAVEGYELRSPSAKAAAHRLSERLDAIASAASERIALRILVVGAGPAYAVALRLAAGGHPARLALVDLDPRRLERARLGHDEAVDVSFYADLDGLPDGGFDLVVSAGGLTRQIVGREALPRLARKCAVGGVLVAVEPAPSLFAVVVGLATDPTGGARDPRLSPEAWEVECARAGWRNVEARLVDTGEDQAISLVAAAPAVGRTANPPQLLEVIGAGDFAARTRDAIAARGVSCRLVESASSPKRGEARTVVWLAEALEADSVAKVAALCLALRDLATGLAEANARLVVGVSTADRPLMEALFAFARTLANETPGLDIRRVGLADGEPATAERLASIALSDSVETDFWIDRGAVRVLRYERLAKVSANASAAGAFASRLEKGADAGLDRLAWRSAPRRGPRASEIEVEVVATGLNFRDVMWALSILPDEMLEDGYAGPQLGLEFAGRVARVGEAVAHLKPGDRVVGLAGGAFATHVVVEAGLVAPLPATLSCESAATVPVAFLTAYYALISCADLREGEWALVHGGAGGVGLAALQIAQWRGARVIVTAGSPEKRALALTLGAEQAFDSRSGAFVDDVMAATGGEGVAVVLNSLAGEAMERSLGLLAPFGRFVELGKRDYLADTAVGLRPFRRNLSYFGVDLDGLLKGRPDVARRLIDDVMARFAAGDFTPLPYTTFGHDEIIEAMRLMQQSGHVGKIVVHPPPLRAAPPSRASSKLFRADPDRTHLITGGLGGFGLAAAEWLVDRGARHLALVGQTGAASETRLEAVATLRRRGVVVEVAALDIADAAAVERFIANLGGAMPPLAGVMHAAMKLDDALAANLDEASLVNTLKPKVAGAEILDRLTRKLPLDYFVLFSSATAAIGNPGQGAYVAANGFLEGLAHARRTAGLPALAVGWGAIADVGVVARSAATRDALADRAGATGVKARTALDALGEALAEPEIGPSVVIADLNLATARAHLPLIASPTYGRIGGADATPDAKSNSTIVLGDLVVGLGPEAARRVVADALAEEIGHILRLPPGEVSRVKPLGEIGLDSLMAVELSMALETRFGLDAPLGVSAGGFTVGELAGHLMAGRNESEQATDFAENLVRRHIGRSDWGEIEPLLTALKEKGVDLSGAPSRRPASAQS